MRVVAVANRKGGVGKTALAVNLAAALGAMKHPTLLIDLDPQGCAGRWLGCDQEGRGILEALKGEAALADVARRSSAAGVEVVIASPELVPLEIGLDRAGGEVVLREALAAVPRGRWDHVVIDCPPSLGMLVVNALMAAGIVLVPTVPAFLELAALERVEDLLTRVQHAYRHHLARYIVVSMWRHCRHHVEAEELLRNTFKTDVFKATIRNTVRVDEAVSYAKAVRDYEGAHPVVGDYEAVARELLRREGK